MADTRMLRHCHLLFDLRSYLKGSCPAQQTVKAFFHIGHGQARVGVNQSHTLSQGGEGRPLVQRGDVA